MEQVAWEEAVTSLQGAYGGVDRVLRDLDDAQLWRPSGCAGWTVCDLAFHMMLDAERALVAFHTPASGPPDVDFVSYWRPWSAADPASISHARFVRISAAAYPSPKVVVSRWRATAAAAGRASRQTSSQGFVSTQGHVLSTPDFIATLTVESAIHHLDLIANLDDRALPAPAAMEVARRTMDGLLGAPVPGYWDDTTYVLKATGRLSLDAEDHYSLGAHADRFPLFS